MLSAPYGERTPAPLPATVPESLPHGADRHAAPTLTPLPPRRAATACLPRSSPPFTAHVRVIPCIRGLLLAFPAARW
jgi:hypothetical protein